MGTNRKLLYSLMLGVVMILGSVAAHAARVFVSSTTQDGNLGGLAGGDQICQGLANAQAFGGTWIAWLSTPSTDAADRLLGNGPFVKAVGGAQIAADRAALLNAESIDLDSFIDEDESGNFVDDEDVWTGTDAAGQSEGNDCTGWTTDNAAVRGATGGTDDKDEYWTEDNIRACNLAEHLYCFEQAGAATVATPIPALSVSTALIIIFALLLVGWNNIRRNAIK